MLMNLGMICLPQGNYYFCWMRIFKKVVQYTFVAFLVMLVSACSKWFKDDRPVAPIARVGETYLYPSDIEPFITKGMGAKDSAVFVLDYINRWAAKQMLLEKSKINLPEEKLREFNRLVDDYRADLYTTAYTEALVQQSQDTAVNPQELRQYYDQAKENFRLNERLVQLRFVVLPNQFLDKEGVVSRLKSFKEEDKIYLDSIAVQFKKIHFNDSIWVSASRVMGEIAPLNYENGDKYLKKSQFFELKDSLGVYLGKVKAVLSVNDTAPLSYIAPDIKRIILNRRRLQRERQLKTEIIDEAIKSKEFEIYAKE